MSWRLSQHVLCRLALLVCADANQRRFGTSGGIRWVTNSMGAHRSTLRIVQVGCRILRNLAASGVLGVVWWFIMG